MVRIKQFFSAFVYSLLIFLDCVHCQEGRNPLLRKHPWNGTHERGGEGGGFTHIHKDKTHHYPKFIILL
jgi:hypothetical protein